MRYCMKICPEKVLLLSIVKIWTKRIAIQHAIRLVKNKSIAIWRIIK